MRLSSQKVGIYTLTINKIHKEINFLIFVIILSVLGGIILSIGLYRLIRIYIKRRMLNIYWNR